MLYTIGDLKTLITDKTKCMRKVLLLIALIIFQVTGHATDRNGDELLSLVSLTNQTATPGKITAMLGKPTRIEESKRRTWWYYTKGTTTMVVCWNNKSEQMEKVSFTSEQAKTDIFDTRLSANLKSGVTDINQALSLLGTPKDMTIRMMTQEMHYAYRNNVLRLFFREKKLVDFCLY